MKYQLFSAEKSTFYGGMNTSFIMKTKEKDLMQTDIRTS